MSFETKRIALVAGAAAKDLAADPDWAFGSDATNRLDGRYRAWAAIQNVSTRIARYALVEAAPAGTATDVGHTLSPGAGVVVLLELDRPFWMWSTTGATLAISEGAGAADLFL